MTLHQNKIINEILQERKKQDIKWGSIPRFFTREYWITILVEEVGEASKAILSGHEENYRQEMIQVAAVAIAAIEDFDYNEK
jgi:NTP pyrophosphatase (non-canonical NTP hydrolase)